MANVVHKFNTGISIYLIKEEVGEAFNQVDDDHVTGWLERLHIEEQLMSLTMEQQE